ncbi:CbrC family protein [Novosphingobium sp. HBC54]|uniref:CbrC family protein n=2 Tax=Novosphingobium cyanobacteriorum TaxID=3024215 RepID=A0ABT6CJZ1_9SPHN|nr:CbrC family protein [Novosphingobium cyanobacteriorum]
MELPKFRYHPAPLSTGSISPSTEACDCCGLMRGFEYTASFYSTQRPKPKLCPWCISSGKASHKYDGEFSDPFPLKKTGIANNIVEEVSKRTPGYNSWQQEEWASHCGDSCEFHGDAKSDEIASLTGKELADHLDRVRLSFDQWQSLLRGYQEGGNPAVYKFICRHCGISIYPLDFT